MTAMEFSELYPDLIAPFAPEDHKDRKVPGGGKWFYLEHTTITDRLNQVCPGNWSDRYTLSHQAVDGDPIYFCELTICGVTRTGIGDKSNEDSNYGTPAQRSFRKAFTDAAERFGIGAYLDEQKKEKREFTIRYMHGKGDGRAVKTAAENGWTNGSLQKKELTDDERQSKAKAETDTIRQKATTRSNGVAKNPNLKRLEDAAGQTGVRWEDAKAAIANAGFKGVKVAEMTEAQVEEAIQAIYKLKTPVATASGIDINSDDF